jgi:hypothetical protein
VGPRAVLDAVVEMRNTKFFVRKPQGNLPFGRPGRRCEDNIRVDIVEIWWESVDWMHLDQDRDQWQAVVNTVMNLIFVYDKKWGIS